MRHLLFVFLITICHNVFSQLGPLSGSQPKSFSTVPDNLGFLENSINSFTGQVQFSMPIASIGSQGKLSYPVTFSYSSANMTNLVSTWNRESPTGVLGLGWSMEIPRIVADHKSTSTHKDDEFFLVEGGATTQLLLTGNPNEFYTSRYTNWKINFDELTETWTIIKDDGTTYRYGDKNSGRRTVRYMVNWGNWIGNSSQPAGQAQTVYTWDLASIADMYGNSLLIEYQQTEEYVAAGNGVTITNEKMHTKASYIKEIRNTYNEKIVFQYISKATTEFKDPHNERSEPDPYQEKYETLALDKIQSYIDGSLAGEVRFGYGSIGSGELTKRILNSITQYSRLGNALPGFLFSYELLTGANFGALKQVTSPLKGTATFSFSNVTLTRTNLTSYVPGIAGFSEPQIYFGDNYVVITRRNSAGGHTHLAREVLVTILTWDGGAWVQSNYNYSIPNVTLLGTGLGGGGNNPHRQEFQISLGKDFFAILPKSSSSIYLFKRDEHKTGQWIFDNSKSVSASSNSTLLSGTDFVFVGTKESSISENYVFTWSNAQWTREAIAKLPYYSSQFFYAVANNYILVHEDTGGPNPDNVKIYYRQPSRTGWNSTPWQSIGGTYGDSYWYGSNSFAVMMAAGGNERIYTWDANYNLSLFDTGIAIADNSFVNNVNNSMAFITVTDNPIRGIAWRYDGASWVSSGTIDFYGPNIYMRNLFSLGDDFVFRPRPNTNFAMKSYDPGSRTWTDPLELSTTSQYVMLAGSNFIVNGGKFYFKNVDAVDSWQYSGTVSTLENNGTGSDFYLQGGLDFVASGIFGLPNSLVVRMKNGLLVSTNAVSIPWSYQRPPQRSFCTSTDWVQCHSYRFRRGDANGRCR